jgi:hypothetical protein
MERGKPNNFLINQWVLRRSKILEPFEFEERNRLGYTYSFLRIFLKHNTELVSVPKYGELFPHVIVASLISGIEDGDISFNWKRDFIENKKRYVVTIHKGCVQVQSATKLRPAEIKVCTLTSYYAWRELDNIIKK